MDIPRSWCADMHVLGYPQLDATFDCPSIAQLHGAGAPSSVLIHVYAVTACAYKQQSLNIYEYG